MKKNYLYIAAAVAALSFSSCSDFLDRYPLEELSDGSFWKNPKDAEMAVSDLYAAFPTMDVDEDINSDNAVHGIKWAAGNVSKGIYDPADFSWSGNYKIIREANKLFEKIDEIPNYPQASKNLVLGQAHFFRAFEYFDLIRSYGDVPYIDKTLTLADQENITRMPRDEVYAKMMADFEKAIELLPVEWPSSDYGRVTKGAAHAFKARAALYYGKFDVALSESKAVMDLKIYELYDKDNTGKYAELFWEKADNCKEFVQVVQFNNPEKTHYLIGWEAFAGMGWGGINPTQSLVEAFEDKDGAPISKSKLYDATNPFKDRDPRLEVNVLHNGESMYGVDIKTAPLKSSGSTGVAQHNDATATGYYQQKWLDPSINPQSQGWDMGKDWVVVRYAEVLLTYAEAKNEISPLDQSAFDAVNQIRKRVGMPELQKTNATLPTYCGTQDELRQRIRNEWRVEFALEGKRMWDIRRWGIAKQVLNAPFEGMRYELIDSPDAIKGDGGKICILYQGKDVFTLTGSHYEDKNYIFPVPQSEIDLNKKLTQNPGY